MNNMNPSNFKNFDWLITIHEFKYRNTLAIRHEVSDLSIYCIGRFKTLQIQLKKAPLNEI